MINVNRSILYLHIKFKKIADIFHNVSCHFFFIKQACIGSFGHNCTGGPCVEGYYGHGCRDMCNCTEQQVCNKYEGCMNRTGKVQNNSKTSI